MTFTVAYSSGPPERRVNSPIGKRGSRSRSTGKTLVAFLPGFWFPHLSFSFRSPVRSFLSPAFFFRPSHLSPLARPFLSARSVVDQYTVAKRQSRKGDCCPISCVLIAPLLTTQLPRPAEKTERVARVGRDLSASLVSFLPYSNPVRSCFPRFLRFERSRPSRDPCRYHRR